MTRSRQRLSLTTRASCASTQLLVRELLDADPATVHVVRALQQSAGQGRHGRSWENPPGAALLMSIGVRRALPTSVLEDLVRRIVARLEQRLCSTFGLEAGALSWSPPNDLVAAASGAKVAGVLVDAVSVGALVRELRIGIGVNITGGAWTTAADARAVATLEQIAGRALPVSDAALDAFALELARGVLELLGAV
jgi:BirA family biotin operon repressor/biotin-[acetyl-CoA-carboxylase] ligase